MDNSFVNMHSASFDSETYVKILIAIAKADRDNGPPEFDYVRKQAQRLGLDYEQLLSSTDRLFDIEKQHVSRLTAFVVLRDAIMLASRDRHFSLPEREKIYTFAARMDISRRDVDHLEEWIRGYRTLHTEWEGLVAGTL
ncbi:MAG: hypothetical protein WAL98_10805 [Desulfatiglandaceae bacterium]|jgi:tellurite resistance protein